MFNDAGCDLATRTSAVATAPLSRAKIVTAPESAVVTTPSAETSATAASDVDHSTPARAALDPASGVAVRRMESPRATYIAFGEIESPGDERTTTIVALSDFPPDVAMTRAVPGATAATLPNEDMLATVGSADRQSTLTSPVW